MGGDTRGEGRAEDGEQGCSPQCTASSPLQCLWGSGLSRSVWQGKYEVIVCTAASVVALGLQTFTSLPSLAEETVLMTAVSPHTCGIARAGSILTAGREQGAKCPSPSTGNGRHQPQGRTWRVCICSITLSNLVLFCTAAGLSALSQGHTQHLGIPV